MTAVSSAGNLDPSAFPTLDLNPAELALREGTAAVVNRIQTASFQKRMREKASPECSFSKVSSKCFLHPLTMTATEPRIIYSSALMSQTTALLRTPHCQGQHNKSFAQNNVWTSKH